MSRKESKTDIKALDERFRKIFNPLTNQEEEVPELDPRWKEHIQFVSYTSVPITIDNENCQPHAKNQASLEEWKERAQFINQDLKYLLCLPHRQFWCQAIFDESLQLCLDSYLKQTPRPFDILNINLQDELLTTQRDLYKRVFMVLLRMSTHKESKDCFFTPEIFGEILYNNYLFDIPKLMDICAVYGGADSENLPLLQRMIDNIFDKQPRYYDDLNETIPSLLATLDNILTKCGLDDPSDSSPQKLNNSKSTVKELDPNELFDIILYLYDIGNTIKNFMETFPQSCRHFLEHGVVAKIATFFEAIVPFMLREIKSQKLRTMKDYMHQAMTAMVHICGVVIKTCCIDSLAESSACAEEKQNYTEDYAQVLTSILPEKRFISFYDAHYSIENDLITIQSYPGSSLDSTRVQYILDAIHSAHEAFPHKQRTAKPTMDDGKTLTNANGIMEEPGTSGSTSDSKLPVQNSHLEAPAASLPRHDVDPVKLDSMVTSVRDLLPDLGPGFVIMCLEEYNYDIETVINSLLEDKLTDSLNKLDRNMTKAQAISSRNETKTIISTRHSVFDKDEFDVFSQGTKIDLSRVHKGKRHDDTNLKSFMANKDHMTDAMKDRFNRYDVYGQLNKPDDFDEYDDEYDDTYDSLDVGAQDDDSADELRTRRPFVVPRILGRNTAEDSPSESEEETEENEENTSTEKASGAQTKWRTPDKRPGNKGYYYTDGYANRGRGQQQGKTEPSTGPKGNKPKGKSKGPVDPATLKQRANKERHKSQRANHNRKAGAEWKRNKGMGALPKQ